MNFSPIKTYKKFPFKTLNSSCVTIDSIEFRGISNIKDIQCISLFFVRYSTDGTIQFDSNEEYKNKCIARVYRIKCLHFYNNFKIDQNGDYFFNTKNSIVYNWSFDDTVIDVSFEIEKTCEANFNEVMVRLNTITT